MVTPANVIRMDELDKSETIVGLSYLKSPVETDTTIIKENKLTILNHICSPKKTEQRKMTQALSIPEQKTPKSKRGSNTNLRLSRSSIYTSSMCVQQ